MKRFNIPLFYESNIIEEIRRIRERYDPRKKNLEPSIVKLNKIDFYIGRHFGFCFGVKNAIEICYQAIANNPNKKIYLLSQMIHNQVVNQDLIENGISFIMDTNGNQLIEWTEIKKHDIVIIPAFGTSLETLKILEEKEIETKKFDTTCPFVSKVWNRSREIARKGYTIVIHGKAKHEETRSTFSRAKKYGPSIIVENIEDVKLLCDILKNKKNTHLFKDKFKDKYSPNFNFIKDLDKIGVVNQTTMLASETQQIINLFTEEFKKIHTDSPISNHIINTRDTLCYATNENQESTLKLLKYKVDLAIIVGGYNSSNTTHLAELASKKVKTYFINSEQKISLDNSITHYDYIQKKEIKSVNFLPTKKCKIILTSGASCPDVVLENIMLKLSEIKKEIIDKNNIINRFESTYKQ
ncbi:MAG: 4-hydroxy-3-methylbut-2-enyl diphosphate reductase [Flavobacteriales bacterium]|nr:4-hydroxy-3-methylbut-2-enyl diphosphate reductase [Flavobacteriales bacterium]|tara:strand:- start:5035 stop:6267 length:1233 start_codon:yes stop_codon:yes gene_type:complete